MALDNYLNEKYISQDIYYAEINQFIEEIKENSMYQELNKFIKNVLTQNANIILTKDKNCKYKNMFHLEEKIKNHIEKKLKK